MEQTVTAGEDVDERAELGDVHDLARVDVADLGPRRVEDLLDTGASLGHGDPVLGPDGDRADHSVVVDVDVGPRLLLDQVDDLALGADHLADLVHGDLEADDLGCGLVDLGAGLGDGVGHGAEDREPGLLGLLQGGGQDVGGETVDLGVQLQGGDELGGTGHLEVHVAEGVLGPQDVGEGDELVALVDEPHGDAGHRSLEGHAGVHQRQGGRADRAHRGRTVRGQHLGHQAQGVGELLHAGHDRKKRPLGQQAVADLAALGRAHPAGLAVGRGRHVVVVHVALLVLDAEGVEELVHPRHAEGEDVQHLGLAPLEQP